MSLIDILLITAIAAALFFAVRFIGRSRGGCSGCNDCGGNCGHCAYRDEKGESHGKR